MEEGGTLISTTMWLCLGEVLFYCWAVLYVRCEVSSRLSPMQCISCTPLSCMLPLHWLVTDPFSVLLSTHMYSFCLNISRPSSSCLVTKFFLIPISQAVHAVANLISISHLISRLRNPIQSSYRSCSVLTNLSFCPLFI